MNRLKSKVAIVTGSGLGIGRATAQEMAKEGATVALTDINDWAGRSVAAEIAAAAGMADFFHLDVGREDQVQRVFAQIHARFGRVDVLVNNAGIAGANKPTDQLTETEWDNVFAVNVKGVFFCTKHAIPYMRQSGGGSIINVSSIYGMIGAPDIPPYHASKGAVRLLTKTDALLYARENIRVNSVHPGYIWTPLVEGLGQHSQAGAEAFRRHLNSLHPIGHIGEPKDVAYGIVYLASDEAKFVTGSELVIDGGYTAQ